MRQVNIHEAKTHFSELIAAVERGETIMIARRGKPIAKLGPREEPAAAPKKKRVFGQWKDRIWVDPAFYEPMSEDELAEWYRPREAYDDVKQIKRERQAG